MPRDRSIDDSGEFPELFLLGDVDSASPLVTQLIAKLRESIRRGRLHPGTRLPATRSLATQLGCSRWVVVQAYEQLTAEGYLTSQTGSGTRVRGMPASPSQPPRLASEEHSWRFDFRTGVPDLTQFPRVEWVRATRTALANASSSSLDYGDPSGLGSLRESVADYLGRVRGADASAVDIGITAGSVSALAIISGALAARGIFRIGVEDPGWIPLRNPFSGSGVQPVPIPVDADGLVVDQLVGQDLRAVLVTPVHQFPVGTVLSAERRIELLRWAERVGGLVIEDDYDSEYRYDRGPLGVLQGVAPEHVVLIGSLSKSLAPGVRLGWILGPPSWRETLEESRRSVDIGVSVLMQATFGEFLRSGGFERHLRRMRREYVGRRIALIDSLRNCFPAAVTRGIPAGLHQMVDLVELPAPAFARACEQHDVRVYPLHRYCLGAHPPAGYPQSTVVLGFGAISARRIPAGVAAMAEASRSPQMAHARRRPLAGRDSS
jgi:GntR family transcriptional regulator / MocR family aminotransferase